MSDINFEVEFFDKTEELLDQAQKARTEYENGKVEAILELMRIRNDTHEFIFNNYSKVYDIGVDESMSYNQEKNVLWKIDEATRLPYPDMWLPSSWELC